MLISRLAINYNGEKCFYLRPLFTTRMKPKIDVINFTSDSQSIKFQLTFKSTIVKPFIVLLIVCSLCDCELIDMRNPLSM